MTLKIICRGCMVYVTVIETGFDDFGHPYQVCQSRGGRFFLGFYDPFDFEYTWDVFSRLEDLYTYLHNYIK